MAKSNLPKTLGSDYTKLSELAVKYNRTTTGNTSYTSPSSSVTYNTAGTAYDGQGEEGLLALLQIALANYIITAPDFNNKIDSGALSDTDIAVDDSGFNTLTGTDQGDINEDIDTILTAIPIDYVRNPGYAVTSGSPTNYTISTTPAPTALTTGMRVAIKLHVDCGITPTLNWDGLGAITLKKNGDTSIIANEYKQNEVLDLVCNGTNFIITSIDYAGEVLTTQGDILYRDATGLQRLAKGTAGSLLKMNTGATEQDYLAIGTAGQVLEVNDTATAPIWRTKLNKQVFTSDGTFTAPKTGIYKVTITGGGGSGGNGTVAGGGGAGGTCIKWVSLTKDDAVAVTVGTGGVYPGSNTAGGNGENSTFGAHCTAGGGSGGAYASDRAAGGAGGTASSGDINMVGGSGGYGTLAGGVNYLIHGIGGGSHWGGGGNYASSSFAYGSGSAGASDDAGADGICLVEW